VGVGRRGRTETYVECHAGLLPDADAAYLWLLCSAEALAPQGSLEQILDASGRFAGDLAERLRERIYQSVVPRLAQGIVAARGLSKPTGKDLAELGRKGAPFDEGDTLWEEVARLFRAVDRGNREWGVPAYDGGLFSEDSGVSAAGARVPGAADRRWEEVLSEESR